MINDKDNKRKRKTNYFRVQKMNQFLISFSNGKNNVQVGIFYIEFIAFLTESL